MMQFGTAPLSDLTKNKEMDEQQLNELKKTNEAMVQHVYLLSHCVAGLYVLVAVGTFCGVYKILSK